MATNEDETGVNPKLKFVLGLLIIIWFLIDIVLPLFFAPDPTTAGREIGRKFWGWLGTACAWFWFAPYLVGIAKENNRNQNWAFGIGVIFSVLGVISYWIYIWVVGGNKIEHPHVEV
jgi:hypothetical protein